MDQINHSQRKRLRPFFGFVLKLCVLFRRGTREDWGLYGSGRSGQMGGDGSNAEEYLGTADEPFSSASRETAKTCSVLGNKVHVNCTNWDSRTALHVAVSVDT